MKTELRATKTLWSLIEDERPIQVIYQFYQDNFNTFKILNALDSCCKNHLDYMWYNKFLKNKRNLCQTRNKFINFNKW